MILLEGPNEYLRRQVHKELRARHDRLGFHVDDEFEMHLKRLLKLLHADNRYHVRENLLGFVRTLSQAEVHMVGTALLATGTVVLVCQEEDCDPLNAQGHYYDGTLGGMLPAMNVFSLDGMPDIVTGMLGLWEQQLTLVNKLQGTDIWSAGGVDSGMVMLVGDRVNPYVPCDEARRLAFVSHQGCSQFLHQALVYNFLDSNTRYYLTNAHKCDVEKMNLKMLQEELELVKPVKVVALGGQPARLLSELKVDFTRTYHPQYWKRFKNKDVAELVELLRH